MLMFGLVHACMSVVSVCVLVFGLVYACMSVVSVCVRGVWVSVCLPSQLTAKVLLQVRCAPVYSTNYCAGVKTGKNNGKSP